MNLRLTFEPGFDKLYQRYLQGAKGKVLLDLEGISPDKIDIGKMSKAYFTERVADVSIDTNANSNEDKNPNNYQAEITKGILKLEGYYLLWKYARDRFGEERANELIDAIWRGDVYFHDASGVGVQKPYCIALSTSLLMLEGRPYGQLYSLPPKRSDSFVAQVTEMCMDISQEICGAISPSDFIVNLCYYLRNEGVDPTTEEGQHYVINLWQKFVHVMNNKFRVSSESPFTNISIFDRKNLDTLFGETVYPDGSKVDIEYVMQVQKIVAEWFSKGDPSTGLPYRFPVFTANISVEGGEVVDKDFLQFVARTNVDKGVYNIYVNEGTKIATCCRLVNSLENRRYRTDTFGNGGLNIGALRVVTVNLPRLALTSSTEADFFKQLEYTLDIARDLLIVHREEIIKRRIEGGFLKFFEPLKWMSLSMYFSVIGIIGLYEMAYNMGEDTVMETEAGQEFVERVLLYIDDYAEEASKYTGHAWSVEEIPGESTAVKFAQKDDLLYGTDFELYSNQYIPLIADFDPIERIKLSGRFMNLVSGGGILHLNMKDRIENASTMEKLIEKAIEAGVPHFALNYGYGICENGHTSVVGTGKTCPICGGSITDWLTRIIGYFTKVSSWNSVRKNFEYPRRKFK